MKETLNPVSPEQRPPFIIRNALVSRAIAYVVDYKAGRGFTKDGHKLFRRLLVRVCQGGQVLMSREAPEIYKDASLSIEVDGQENIPSWGPTVFVGNHTRGGPMDSMGQYFEMVKSGYNARSDERDNEVREPFVIVQRGLEKGRIIKFLSGIFYEIASNSLNCEIVAIPRYNESGEIVNGQRLRDNAIQRIVDGGASLWLPQGRHRDPDDLSFPEKKGSGFLGKINERDRHVQIVPVRSIPDSKGNIKIVFGQSVDVGHVVRAGGINYFAQNHIAPLK